MIVQDKEIRKAPLRVGIGRDGTGRKSKEDRAELLPFGDREIRRGYNRCYSINFAICAALFITIHSGISVGLPSMRPVGLAQQEANERERRELLG